jgi:FtsP/CotA-like multicopper oxidase with cupredoxin domain
MEREVGAIGAAGGDMPQRMEELRQQMMGMQDSLMGLAGQMNDANMLPLDLAQRMTDMQAEMQQSGAGMMEMAGMMQMMGGAMMSEMAGRMEEMASRANGMGWQLGGMVGAAAMPGMAHDYNYFTINGKAFPSSQPYQVKQGDVARVRIINPSQTIHPMHLHGHDFKVVAKDGEPIPGQAQLTMNTVTLNPGETYDIVFIADNPGRWVFHCHDLHHASNNGVEPGGLVVMVEYEGYEGPALETAPQPLGTPSMPGMGH